MEHNADITINLPAEHYDVLSEVILTGLKRAKISSETRRELRDWWEAEREFILEELKKTPHD